MDEQFSRFARLVGEDGVSALHRAGVAVFGLGGVGSFCAEALARSGVGRLLICDADTVDVTNINRQAIAYLSTVGQRKVDLVAARARDISPDILLDTRPVWYDAESAPDFDLSGYDFVVDCVDTVSAKLLLAERCRDSGTPLIMCMGTGNKLDPSRLQITDISKTHTCPLAKVMRRELKARGILHLPLLFSDEPPIAVGGRTPGSSAFVPSSAGLMLAGYVVRSLLERHAAEAAAVSAGDGGEAASVGEKACVGAASVGAEACAGTATGASAEPSES